MHPVNLIGSTSGHLSTVKPVSDPFSGPTDCLVQTETWRIVLHSDIAFGCEKKVRLTFRVKEAQVPSFANHCCLPLVSG